MVDIKKIEEIVKPLLTKHDVSLYSCSFSKGILEILIDSSTGIDLDKCVEVSETISKELDRLDPIKEEYCLEVASAGAEKPLKTKEQFIDAINKYVLIQVNQRVEDYDELVGFIREVKEDSLILEIKIKTRVKNVEIALDNISYAITTVNI